MSDRFLATVIAPSERALRDLQRYHLDLFRTTASRVELGTMGAALGISAQETGQWQFAIEGSVTMEDIQRLVSDGYQVLIHRPAPRQAQANVLEFEEWLKGWGG